MTQLTEWRRRVALDMAQAFPLEQEKQMANEQQQAKHTPGPWEFDQYGNSFVVTAKQRVYDVAVVRNIGSENNEANARLISAAPDLLAIANELGEWFGLTKPLLDQWEDLAEEFHKETGFLRPGKDYPMAAGLDEEREAERSATWRAWSEKRRADMIGRLRAAIAKAENAS